MACNVVVVDDDADVFTALAVDNGITGGSFAAVDSIL